MSTHLFLTGIFVIFSVWFLRTAAQTNCPPAGTLSPCTCEEFISTKVLCKNITRMELINEILDRSGDFRFQFFILERSTLMFLPARSLISKRISSLKIKNTRLMGLFDAVPSSSNALISLELKNVIIQRGIKWEFFQKMVKLKELQLINMNLKSLGKEFGSNVNPELIKLEIQNAQISKLSDGVFVGLKNIQTLILADNKIKELKRSFFDKPSNIKILAIRGNLLETLPDDIFTDMPYLYDVDLSWNKFKYLPQNIFSPILGSIWYLRVIDNPIICDCKIEWITKISIYPRITGSCGDKSLIKKGESFGALTANDFQYCH